jgi:hypothetical protein
MNKEEFKRELDQLVNEICWRNVLRWIVVVEKTDGRKVKYFTIWKCSPWAAIIKAVHAVPAVIQC